MQYGRPVTVAHTIRTPNVEVLNCFSISSLARVTRGPVDV